MDRPIRPLFPAGFIDEVQIQAIVMASDRQYDPDVLAMNGASAALTISTLPFQGPIGSVRLGMIDGQFIPFPSTEQLEESELDLIVSGSRDAILMIEGFAREMPEDKMAEAIAEAHRVIREICDLQEELVAKVGTVKDPVCQPTVTMACYDRLEGSAYHDDFKTAKQTEGKQNRAAAVKALKEKAKAAIIPDPKAEGAITDARVQQRAGASSKNALIRDLILGGIASRWPRSQDDPRFAFAKSTCCRASTVRPCFNGAKLKPLITIVLGTVARRTKGRWPGRRILQEVHARLQLPAVLRRRNQADPRARPARNRPRHVGRTKRQAGAAGS